MKSWWRRTMVVPGELSYWSGRMHVVGIITPVLFMALQSILFFAMVTFLRVRKDIPAGLSANSVPIYQPEKDIPVYVACCVASVLGTIFLLGFANRLVREQPEERRDDFALFSSAFEVLVSAVMFGCFYACFDYLRRIAGVRTELVEVCLSLPLIVTLLASTLLRKRGAAWMQWYVQAHRQFDKRLAMALDIAAGCLIVLLVYVPDCRLISGFAMTQDHFHHLNYFVMSPAIAYKHGAALVTDVYSQYGVGWPCIIGTISQFTGLKYDLPIFVGMLYACVYFIGLYTLCRMLMHSRCWSLVATLMALFLQMFNDDGVYPLWIAPSASVLRFSMDVWVFILLLLICRKNSGVLTLLSGAFVGLALFMETDTGIFLSVMWLVFWAMQLLSNFGAEHRRGLGRQIGWIVAALFCGFIVLFIGLAIATRGTCFTGEFWRAWLGIIVFYGNGLGMIPIAFYPTLFTLGFFSLIIGIYLATVLVVLVRLFSNRMGPIDAFLAAYAVYGTMVMLLFVGRSHPWNMYHSIIPWCVLSATHACHASRWIRHRLSSMDLTAMTKMHLRLCDTMATMLLAVIALSACVGLSNWHVYPNAIYQIFVAPTLPAMVDDDLLGVKVPAVPREKPLGMTIDFPTNALIEQYATVVRNLHEKGKSVLVLSEADAAIYVAADVKPWWCITPILSTLFWESQIDELMADILAKKPDYIFAVRQPEHIRPNVNCVPPRVLDLISQNMVKIEPLGNYDVWVWPQTTSQKSIESAK